MTWRRLIPELSALGFRVVAPYMRGYAPTSVPADGAYRLIALADDAAALHDAFGGDDRAVIIGHDWGGAAALSASARQPERWRAAVVLSWPPTGNVPVDVVSHEQLRRSWYVFFFRQQGAERVIGAHLTGTLGRLWADWSPGFDASQEVARATAALAGAEHLTAALGYYRALPELDDPHAAPVVGGPQPTLYVHGVADGCLGIETAEDAEDHLSADSQVVCLERVGHFPQLEDPDRVNGLIVDFVSSAGLER
jgi:pimeloyl-ACP methyl ester carboxylesterase